MTIKRFPAKTGGDFGKNKTDTQKAKNRRVFTDRDGMEYIKKRFEIYISCKTWEALCNKYGKKFLEESLRCEMQAIFDGQCWPELLQGYVENKECADQ